MAGIVFVTQGCFLTATVVFTNWTSNEYVCSVDGVEYGTVYAFGRLPATGINLGRHLLSAHGPTDYTTFMSVTLGENNWDFNKP